MSNMYRTTFFVPSHMALKSFGCLLKLCGSYVYVHQHHVSTGSYGEYRDRCMVCVCAYSVTPTCT